MKNGQKICFLSTRIVGLLLLIVVFGKGLHMLPDIGLTRLQNWSE
jgi:hypothetical protein